LGEAAALLTAVAWAVAVILFRRSGERVHPLGLNFFKSTLAAVLFVPTIYFAGGTLLSAAPRRDYLVLLASGALGIGVGDTFFFFSLNSLGAGRIAIVECLYSPFVIGLAALWLGERLSGLQAIGASLVLSAVFAVAREGRRAPDERRSILRGVLFGALGLAAMAVGIVMVKPLLERSPILWVTEIRLFGGIAALAIMLALHPARRAILGLDPLSPSAGAIRSGRSSDRTCRCSLVSGMKLAPLRGGGAQPDEQHLHSRLRGALPARADHANAARGHRARIRGCAPGDARLSGSAQ
jgi:drug/metabolite transporter (DMT)-like permease